MRSIKNSVVTIIAITVFFSGILNITSTFFLYAPYRLRLLREYFPLELSNLSRTATIIAGFFLIFVSKGLLERKKRAWLFSVILISISSFLHVIKGLDIEEAFILLVILTALIYTRQEFYVKSSTQNFFKNLKTSLLILLLLFIYSFAGMFLLNKQFDKPVTFNRILKDYQFTIFGVGQDTLIPKTRRARWFNDSLSTVGFSVLVLFFANLFFPVTISKLRSEEEHKRARDLIITISKNPASYMCLMKDKHFFFSQTKNSFIAYKVSGTIAVCLGDPIANQTEQESIIKNFEHMLKLQGLTPVFLSVTEDYKNILSDLGYKSLKIGEDAIIKTSSFTLEGKRVEDIRHGVSRMQREGVYYKWFKLDQIPQKVSLDLKIMHASWIKSKKISGLTFSVDFFPLPKEPYAYLLTTYTKDNKMQAAFSFFPFDNKQGYALDLMLRGQTSINGIMEASIAEAVRFFKELHVVNLSLGVAPLADANPQEERGLLNKTTTFLFNNFNQFYNYQSLFKFKDKFAPNWESRYLSYKSGMKLIPISLSIVKVHTKSSLIGTVLKKSG